MRIREARLSDYENIMLLIERNGLKSRSEQNWINLWINNPIFNKDMAVIGWVAVDANKIIGFFGSFPMQYHYNNKTFVLIYKTIQNMPTQEWDYFSGDSGPLLRLIFNIN